MAIAEDAASVLEQFVQDGRSIFSTLIIFLLADLNLVANLPAEIAHLLEEIQAKDRVIQECRNTIHARDNSIQKFVKVNGSHIPNPKEEAYGRTILANYDRAQIVQEEKVGLSEKAGVIVSYASLPTSTMLKANLYKLDRHIKRLDLKIRDLQNEGTISADPPLPSLLHPSSANRVPPISASTTGASTPLNPLSGNAGPSTTIANSGLARLAHPPPTGQRTSSTSVTGSLQPHHPLLASTHLGTSAPATPGGASAIQVHHQRHRESSAGAASDLKRRRFGQALNSLPSTSSGLARQSSLGPGTPKAGTPGSTRGGSVGPRAGLKKGANKKLAPHQQLRRLHPSKHANKRRPGRRLPLGMTKASASDTADDDSVLSEVDGSGSENLSQSQMPGGAAGAGSGAEDEMEMEDGAGEEEDAGDDRKYCTCHGVSYGSMVACDNVECPYEWFHWSCVGITKEPQGRWYCDECRARMEALPEK